MTAVDLSGTTGLIAMGLLTLNILLGLLLSTNYNPVRRWPHRKIEIFTLHNWTGYIALPSAGPGAASLVSTAAQLQRAGRSGVLPNRFRRRHQLLPSAPGQPHLEEVALHGLRGGRRIFYPRHFDRSEYEESTSRSAGRRKIISGRRRGAVITSTILRIRHRKPKIVRS